MTASLDGPDSTKNAAKDVAGEAKDKATDVAQHGKQAAQDVAGTASAAASDVVHEGKQQARELLGTTKTQLAEQAEGHQYVMISALRDMSDQLSGMLDGADRSGAAVELVSAVRDRSRTAADWLDERDLGDIVEEVRRLGRARPGAYLLGALTAGVVAGRLTRGVAAVHTDDDTAAIPSAASADRSAMPAAGRPTPARHDADARQPALGGAGRTGLGTA